jgi:hypothetical protein
MGGGLMQLVAYGAQDIYLTGNPQITFWKLVYRRNTNFAIESIEQTFAGAVDFGNRVTCSISRNGDLISKMYLVATLPSLTVQETASPIGTPGDAAVLEYTIGNLTAGITNVIGTNSAQSMHSVSAAWTEHVGHALIDEVIVEIGGQLIDKHYGVWLEIWNELTLSSEKEEGMDELIGPKKRHQLPMSAKNERIIHVPLQFWFNRNPGLALPLIALQYHEVKIIIQLKELNQLCTIVLDGRGIQGDCRSDWVLDTDNVLSKFPSSFMGVDNKNTASGCRIQGTGATVKTSKPLKNCQLWVDYVYLDTEERRRFAQQSHEYLIEQLQFNGATSTPSTATTEVTGTYRINFNHPVKELIWVYQDKNRCCPTVANITKNAWFNFGWNDHNLVYPGYLTDSATANVTGNNNLAANPFILDCVDGADMPLGTCGTPKDGRVHDFLSSSYTNKIQLNGHDRFAPRPNSYFSCVQPYQHHSRVPESQIYNYSFSLRPEEHQPSGTCNFSRIDNAQLQYSLQPMVLPADAEKGLSPNNESYAPTLNLMMFATNYNVLRVMSGMGGLAYSN